MPSGRSRINRPKTVKHRALQCLRHEEHPCPPLPPGHHPDKKCAVARPSIHGPVHLITKKGTLGGTGNSAAVGVQPPADLAVVFPLASPAVTGQHPGSGRSGYGLVHRDHHQKSVKVGRKRSSHRTEYSASFAVSGSAARFRGVLSGPAARPGSSSVERLVHRGRDHARRDVVIVILSSASSRIKDSGENFNTYPSDAVASRSGTVSDRVMCLALPAACAGHGEEGSRRVRSKPGLPIPRSTSATSLPVASTPASLMEM